jgi:hypothetical protein
MFEVRLLGVTEGNPENLSQDYASVVGLGETGITMEIRLMNRSIQNACLRQRD